MKNTHQQTASDGEIRTEITSNAERDEVDTKVTVEITKKKILTYGISERPPIYLTIFFAFQQLLIALPWNLSVAVMISDIVCARHDEKMKAQLLSTTLFLSGACTLLQNVVGVRLPVYQGPTIAYLVPILTLSTLPEWQCPAHDMIKNITGQNETMAANEEFRHKEIYPRLQIMAGSLMLAGAIHTFIGLSGILGILLKFIGPVTIVPTIFLVGVALYKTVCKFCQTHWGISGATTAVSLILSLYLERFNMPIPVWTRKKGFHIIRFPFHQVFSLLIAIIIGWVISAILTSSGMLTTDTTSEKYFARTDANADIIQNTPWFIFPYPGQFGRAGLSLGVFAGFMTSTFVSILDSIADYYAIARITNSPPPPVHAINRGILIEGLLSTVAGTYGACHATTTYGSNIGAVGITKVGSRSVFVVFAIILMLFGFLGKIGAFFITVPYPVLGGTQLCGLGIFMGLVLANMQYLDIKSNRNLAIIGISILLGMILPYWIEAHPEKIKTGKDQVDNLLRMLIGNTNVVGGGLACFLDNTIPGSDDERGITAMSTELTEQSSSIQYDESSDLYQMKWLTNKLSKFTFLEKLPFYPTYKRTSLEISCKRRSKTQ